MDDEASTLSPAQAGFRFLIEVAALASWGGAGWQLAAGWSRAVWMIALPLAAAVLWGTFRVAGDRSAGSDGAVAVPGRMRLLVEIVVLFGAAAAIGVAWRPWSGIALAGLVAIHFGATARRVRWLVTRRD